MRRNKDGFVVMGGGPCRIVKPNLAQIADRTMMAAFNSYPGRDKLDVPVAWGSSNIKVSVKGSDEYFLFPIVELCQLAHDDERFEETEQHPDMPKPSEAEIWRTLDKKLKKLGRLR